MKTFVTIVILASTVAAAVACNKDTAADTTQTTGANMNAPDNTRMNARDRGPTVTPIDQGNNAADLETTQAIRKAIMGDSALSMNAKNVKIITNHAVVTLRGPVNSDAEKKNIEAKATTLAGDNRVDDQLEVTP